MTNLGIYETHGALDHDIAMTLDAIMSDFEDLGVDRKDTLKAIHRWEAARAYVEPSSEPTMCMAKCWLPGLVCLDPIGHGGFHQWTTKPTAR